MPILFLLVAAARVVVVISSGLILTACEVLNEQKIHSGLGNLDQRPWGTVVLTT
jgi:hypothetical protein